VSLGRACGRPGTYAAGGEALILPGHRKAIFGIGVRTYMEAL